MIRVVLVGGGGHASDVLGVIEDLQDACGIDGERIEVAGILDDGEVDPTRFEGRSVAQIGDVADLATVDATHYVLAVGWPTTRRAVHERTLGAGPEPLALVHPTATVGRGVEVGAGTVVMAGVHLSPMARVGVHACLSNHVILGHDCLVGDFAGLMPGSVASGNTVIGEGCLVGTNATIVERVVLGDWCTLGAGGVAIADVAPGAVAVGVPARPIDRR